MIKLKSEKTLSIGGNTALSRRAKSLSNLRPPWKPGESGNVNGRPKVLTECLSKELRKKIKVSIGKGEDGQEIFEEKMRAECIAEAIVDKASTTMKESVAAFTAIRQTLEPNEKEETEIAASALHTAFLSGFLRMARAKPADAIEV